MMQARTTVLAILIAPNLVSLIANAQKPDMYELLMTGQNMNAEQVKRLESDLESSSNDVDSRTKLLGYYFLRTVEEPESKKAQRKHILWLIEHRPDAPILELPYAQLDPVIDTDAYAVAKNLWQQHIENDPENLELLANIASFFFIHDRDSAIDALQRGAKLDPQNPSWPNKLGQIYLMEVDYRTSKARSTDLAERAFGYFESAYELSNAMERRYMLGYLADAALIANRLEKAQKYAELMLADKSRDWNYGNNVHYGNLALGRIALINGDVESAKEYLLEAGRTPGSPQLDSFGPNMELARQLLERGEKDVILQYFELCGKFWDNDGELEEWTALVQAGLTPDFSMNL